MVKNTKSNTKLAILCSDDYHHKYLINYLCERHNVVVVITEPYKNQLSNLLKKKKYKDLFYYRYHFYRRKIVGYDRYRRDFFRFTKNIDTCLETHIVMSINDSVTSSLLSQYKPDVTVVMGTGILNNPIIEKAGQIINIHGGYLPDYRGNHCFFFALYNRDFDKIGSTIHFINAGIDKGDIICHIIPTITKNDNPETLYSKSEKEAIHKLSLLIKSYEQGEEFPRQKQLFYGKLYKMRDRGICKDVSFFFRRKNFCIRK